LDRAGIIYYGQYLRFFEIAETELFRAAGLSYSEVFDRFDIWLPRVQIHFDFRRPLKLDDERLDGILAWVKDILLRWAAGVRQEVRLTRRSNASWERKAGRLSPGRLHRSGTGLGSPFSEGFLQT
jgi:YbgC/YbaW family acyl-CoA thioester hydrolase